MAITDRRYRKEVSMEIDVEIFRMKVREMRNIEEQIRELEQDEDVIRAIRYEEYKEGRLAYLQSLKQLRRKGQKLRENGWEVPKDAED